MDDGDGDDDDDGDGGGGDGDVVGVDGQCCLMMVVLVVLSKGMVMKEMMGMFVLVMLFKILVNDEDGGLDEGCST